MKRYNEIQLLILETLQDGQYHSGEAIAKALGLSRTAVWKHIRHWMDIGITIESKSNQGYRLSKPFIPLNEGLLTSLGLPCQIFATIDSTNDYLKRAPALPSIEICCAEQQTNGRGRFNRAWLSPFGENIYCSIRWPFYDDVSKLSGFSLIIGLALIKALQKFSVEGLQLKWPNDILWQDKKLGGILIEMQAESHSATQVIIGIGLNVNMTEQVIDKPWCSLKQITNHYWDRNLLIIEIIAQINQYLEKFKAHGFHLFLNEWDAIDYLKNKWITINQFSHEVQGMAVGVNDLGQLKLVKDSQTLEFSSGEASVKL